MFFATSNPNTPLVLRHFVSEDITGFLHHITDRLPKPQSTRLKASYQAGMAFDPAHLDRSALPNKQKHVRHRSTFVRINIINMSFSLIDYITELFRKAGKLDAQNTQHISSTHTGGYNATHLRCVIQLLRDASENLAKEAYCFMPGDHGMRDQGR